MILKSRSASERAVHSFLRRFMRHDESAATAVEFALIIPVFIGCLMFALLLGSAYLSAMTLDAGVMEAGRKIRVGEVDSKGMTRNQFKAMVCEEVITIDNSCEENLILDVRSAATIPALPDGEDIYTNGVLDPSRAQYDPGQSEDYVIVQTFLPITALKRVMELLGDVPDEEITVSGTVIFKSEPF